MGARYVSIRQAVERLNGAVGKSLIYRLAAERKIRHTKLGGKILIDADHLEAMLAANAVGPAEGDGVVIPDVPAPAPPPRRSRRRPAGRLDLW